MHTRVARASNLLTAKSAKPGDKRTCIQSVQKCCFCPPERHENPKNNP